MKKIKLLVMIVAVLALLPVFSAEQTGKVGERLLKYVEGSAGAVVYGDIDALMDTKLWQAAERITRKAEIYSKIIREFTRETGIPFDTLRGKVVIWSGYKYIRAVIGFEEADVETLEDVYDVLNSSLRKHAKDRSYTYSNGDWYRIYQTKEVRIDQSPALVYFLTYKNSGEEPVTKVLFTLIFDEKNNVFQIFIDELPDLMLTPRRKITRIASVIDTDNIISAVVSGSFITLVCKEENRDFRNKFPGDLPIKYAVLSAESKDYKVNINLQLELVPEQ